MHIYHLKTSVGWTKSLLGSLCLHTNFCLYSDASISHDCEMPCPCLIMSGESKSAVIFISNGDPGSGQRALQMIVCYLHLGTVFSEHYCSLHWLSPTGAILQSIRIWFLPWKHHSEPILCLHACNVASLPAVSLPFISACSWPSDPSCSEPEPWAVFVKRSLQRFSRGKGFSSTALLIYGWKTAHVQSFRKKNVWLIQGCIKKLYTL